MHNRTLQALEQCLKVKQSENAAQTYTINYAALLDGETVSTSSWTAETSGITIANQSSTDTTTSARLSADPGRYRVTNQILTSGGDTVERYIDLTVMDNDSGFISDYGYNS